MALQNLTPELASQLGASETKGAFITDVEADGPAGEAGLRQGDVVRSFAGTTIDDGGDLARAVAEAKAGSRVPVGVIRNGRTLSLAVLIGSDARQEPETAELGGMGQRPSFGFSNG